MEVQLDFMYCIIRNNKHVVLHIVDSGTAYSEAAIEGKRNIVTIFGSLGSEYRSIVTGSHNIYLGMMRLTLQRRAYRICYLIPKI